MEREEKQQALGLRILQTCRAELCELFPYLDSAFSSLDWQFSREKGFCTDAKKLCFSASELLRLYSRNPAAVRRGYLHMLLHCLFLHLFRPADAQPRLWDLACDMAVEQLIQREEQPRLAQDNAIRQACFAQMGAQALSAEEIQKLLACNAFPYPLEELEGAFRFDDHHGWEFAATPGVRRHWESLLLDAARKKAGKGKRGATAGSAEETVCPAPDARYDYRRFLQRFTFSREEVELDLESFDYIFYNLGMAYYGDMPLMEPLEYKEVRRLEELVIAIDTSGSCSPEVVGRFLAESYSILAEQGNFFRKMNVYFIQCDCTIQDVTQIRSKEDWLEYVRKITIRGRSGTDFSPVFALVEGLQKEKKLKDLKALLYFTDGDGAYPTQPPSFETAFVLPRETGHPELIPHWGRLLLI